jgi:hypothetical protein
MPNAMDAEFQLYVNGSLVATSAFTGRIPTRNNQLTVVGNAGLAIGRGDPTMAPPVLAPFVPSSGDYEQFLDKRRGADAYWAGQLDEFRIWNSARSENDILESLYQTCNFSKPGSQQRPVSLVLCYTFDYFQSEANTFTDFGMLPPTHAVAIVGDRHAPWCITRGDGGALVDKVSLQNFDNLGESWGTCIDRPRLPGVGFDYDKASMMLTAQNANLESFPGCANIALKFIANRAER